jgi:peptidoglycan/xylan/chitin deacetylase (PgdA/CDA1 family)
VLTFDDGPGSRLTPAVLDILSDYDAKATFFLLGGNIVGRESIVKRIYDEGHEICSHGYDHINHWKALPGRTLADIEKGWQAINRWTRVAHLVRDVNNVPMSRCPKNSGPCCRFLCVFLAR